MQRAAFLLTSAFPLWILLASVLALRVPEAFVWFSGDWITWGLGLIMLGMGLTLTFDDFRAVLGIPRAGVIGVIAQFVIMPSLGWVVAHLLELDQLDPALAAGLILVACCPGGTASNVITYLAGANVALSVLMTTVSTFAAIALTPLLTQWLAGKLVTVDAARLCLDTFKVVVVPVLLGVVLNQRLPRLARRVAPFSPLVSALAIVLIVASIIGQKRELILTAGPRLLAAPALLHLGGFALGYLASRLLRLVESDCRTVAIEVGMQNSGLGSVLATQHFPGTAAPVPCAISAVYHSLMGSLLAGWWRWRDARRAAAGRASTGSSSAS
jgi:BASS family bile acid:Na+ symporter